ncbi:hypothetical protein [Rathayibacter sp. VKM Ac-2760]|uniref:hypothetical protein n=1 Tax=Rathayibacter sp. VKM Ac-2760 TaxID=2609253 RepID=UPI0013181B75|nr:hypothetical protein [Rathayibacter sp. VKM Ac-2760]QHC60022.1 hypothetical protein GSU72_16785 [Rathayibacter sp. VKM Ac-2760]
MSVGHFVLSTIGPWDDAGEIIGVYSSDSWAREAAASWLGNLDREAFPQCVIESWNGSHRLSREVLGGLGLGGLGLNGLGDDETTAGTLER